MDSQEQGYKEVKSPDSMARGSEGNDKRKVGERCTPHERSSPHACNIGVQG
jgi:hypothetical protein